MTQSNKSQPTSTKVFDFDLDLDRYVAKLENAGGANSIAALQAFVPETTHPRYQDILLELMRVDMELAGERGEARRAHDYWTAFDLQEQSGEAWDSLCKEERRLRPAIAKAEVTASSGSKSAAGSQAGTNATATPHLELPKIREEVAGFRILGELGVGAFSRVYLAEDTRLASRQVVLKFSKHFPGEAQVLSRLQHKNIVPIYSWHRHGEYHVVCMPFYGSTTLADLQRRAGASSEPLTGKSLIRTLDARASRTWVGDRSSQANHSSNHASVPIMQRLGLENLELADRLSRLDEGGMALWMMAELAEGLQHAHERQILHRDIKPANILVTDEGLPMLLDFNLAKDERGVWMDEGVGGTLRYMSPEQLRSVSQPSTPIDCRSDVYGLGLVFYEMLYGTPAYPDHRIRTKNLHTEADVIHAMLADRASLPKLPVENSKGITPAVVSILSRCLATPLQDRYQTAKELVTDLRCQLEDRPLKYAAERSLQERIGKWNRRHPKWSIGTMAMGLGLILVCLSGLFYYRWQSANGLMEAQAWLKKGDEARVAARTLLTGPGTPKKQLIDVIDQCNQALRPELRQKYLARLPREEQSPAQAMISQLTLYRARGNWRLASVSQAEAMPTLLQAVADDCQAITSEQDKAALGKNVASNGADIAELLLAAVKRAQVSLSEKGDVSEAIVAGQRLPAEVISQQLQLTKEAAPTEAANAWYWLSLAQLQYQAGEKSQAMNSAMIAIEIDSTLAWPYFLVGLVQAETQQFPAAKAQFSKALQHQPELGEALLNRAVVEISMGEHREAIQDLNALEKQGDLFPRLYFIREFALRGLGKHQEAEKDRKRGLELEARDGLGWNAKGEAWLRAQPATDENAQQAVICFKQAIACDPELRNAYENMAHAYSERLHDMDSAVGILGTATERFPDYALAWSSRAVLLARMGQIEPALADGEKAIQLERSPFVCYQTASALSILANYETHKSKTFGLLRETLRQDPSLARWMADDADLKNWHENPDFQALLTAARTLMP